MLQTLTTETLKELIKEAMVDFEKKRQRDKIKRMKQREKDEKHRADSMFRNTDLGRLARGITEQPVRMETAKSIEDCNYKLAKNANVIQTLSQENAILKKELAKTKGFMSWQRALETFNQVNKAEKGELNKPDTK